MKEQLEQLHALSMQMETIIGDLAQAVDDEIIADLRYDIEEITGTIQEKIDSL